MPITKVNQMEFERNLITRFRTGCHNLHIEKGRHRNPVIPRDQRLCRCNTGIQTLKHFLLECPILNHLRTDNNLVSVAECITSEVIMKYIIEGVKVLKIELW